MVRVNVQKVKANQKHFLEKERKGWSHYFSGFLQFWQKLKRLSTEQKSISLYFEQIFNF